MAKDLDLAKNLTPTYQAEKLSNNSKEAARKKLDEFIKEETRMVKGMFQNFENPGSSQKITVRKYPGIPHFEKEMQDGEYYEIPLYAARFLNGIDVTAGALAGDNKNDKIKQIGTCSYVKHGFVLPSKDSDPSVAGLGQGGIPVPIVGVAKRMRRFGFQSVEFAGI